MKVAHVRERHAPAGAPWRLAAGARCRRGARGAGSTWRSPVDARSRGRPALAHDAALYPPAGDDARRPPGSRPPGRGAARPASRASSRATRTTTRSWTPRDLVFGPPVLRPPSLRDFYAFEGHVRTMWERRGGEVPEAWYRLPIFYFSNVSEIRGPGRPDLVAGGVAGARLRARGGGDRRHAGASTCPPSAPRRRSAATRSSTTGRRATCSARRWRSGSGRPRARTSRAPSGRGWSRRTSWPTRAPGTGYDLAMTAEVNGIETSRGRWSDAQFSFGEMLARASADARLRPGDLVGSGTVGTGCLLEVARRDARAVPGAGRRGGPAHRATRRPPQPDRDQGMPDRRSNHRPSTRLSGVATDHAIEPIDAAPHRPGRRRCAGGSTPRGSRPVTRRWSARRPDWDQFDRSHPADCRLVARADRPDGPWSAGRALGRTRRAAVYRGVAWESVYVAEDSTRPAVSVAPSSRR